MIPDAEKLKIVMVSEDWFARSMLASTALDSGLFSRVISTDDGYAAIAETWQCIEDGAAPDIMLADDSLGVMSAEQLCRTLRENRETEGVFVAVLTEGSMMADAEVPRVEGADYATARSAGTMDLATLVQEVTSRAVNLIRGQAA